MIGLSKIMIMKAIHNKHKKTPYNPNVVISLSKIMIMKAIHKLDGVRYSRDIHLAGKPVPEGTVGHLGYPNGKELCPSAPPTCPTVT